MSRRRVLLFLKPSDVYSGSRTDPKSLFTNPKIRNFLNDRCKVHKETINICQDVLQRKSLDWAFVSWNKLCEPIRHVDLVIAVGGDGTLLQASHFIDDSTPIMGVNSDPTKASEVEEFKDEFDATRSTGCLCASTSETFEQVLGEIVEGHKDPTELTRISVCVNGHLLPTYALNDLLMAHPCPATVSRLSFRLKTGSERSSLINCRSSGFRVSTATGSTAAMLSSGGYQMPISSKDLQFMVREPILPSVGNSHFMHGLIKYNQSIEGTWYSNEGVIYIDGSRVFHTIKYGDTFEISTKAPCLKAFLPSHLLQ